MVVSPMWMTLVILPAIYLLWKSVADRRQLGITDANGTQETDAIDTHAPEEVPKDTEDAQ